MSISIVDVQASQVEIKLLLIFSLVISSIGPTHGEHEQPLITVRFGKRF
jgi:hypothetical protein